MGIHNIVSMMAVNSGSTRYKNIKDRRNLIACRIYKAHGLLSDVQKNIYAVIQLHTKEILEHIIS